MLLDVSMCLVVLFSDFGINTNPKILCPEDLFQADHELQHLQKTVFGTKEKNHYKAAAGCCRPLSHQEEESPLLRCEIVHNAGLYAQEDQLCAFLNGRQRRNRLCWAREHVSLDAATMGFCAVHRRVQISQWRVIQASLI
ncbi:hypothetical protein TNCV_1836231 [Trichonephila clavipes]|nr:hypothetical protein TNCV_1836231 [Trichonephila clavipes]